MSEPAAALAALRTTCHSAILATVGADGAPDASYAPWAEEGGPDGALLVLVSRLARHTANLLHARCASVMLIEDESAARQIFARRRATYACRVEPVARDTAPWDTGVAALQRRHGDVVTTLRGLQDFQLLRLVPESGSLVLGFGRAWRLGGPGCATIETVGR